MSGVVVHHEMNVEITRDSLLDLVEEAPELGRAMARIAAADDRSGRDVECREQRGRAVTGVVMRAPLDLAGPHRQDRLASVEGLDLALLVDAQHEARAGGTMYKPTMSRTFVTKSGSVESLKVSAR